MARQRVQRGGNGPVESDEQRGSPEMGTAIISGATFANKSVTYYNVNGVAILEGDIALGTVEEVEQTTATAREAVAADPSIVAFGVGVTGSQFRWPNCQIPYEIDPALPNQQRVTDAIAHWEANTPFRFPLRTAANAAQFPNYVHFTDAGGCWSLVGMRGGRQDISLGPGCTAGNAIHEIGHTVGLWHEQSREDRDLFVTINWQNIQAGMAAQFNQHIVDGDDWGAYDYGSIMHYPRTAFSANGQDTITPADPNAQIGQRNGLSAGDIGAVHSMYPNCGWPKTPASDPGGFKKIADDRPPIKKLRDDQPPFKKIRDDGPFKKIRDDGPFKKLNDDRPPVKKLRDDLQPKKLRDDDLVIKGLRDPKLPRDPGPVKATLDPITGLPPVSLPPVVGGLQPFSVATPHHAAGAFEFEGGQEAAMAAALAYPAALQRQLLELEAAMADAQATAANANADLARLQEAAEGVAAALEQALQDLGGV